MTESALKEIVRRAVSDAAFRGQLQTDPAKALAGFSLTAQERSALTTGDPTQLAALGLDQRMTKAFIAGDLGAASKVVISDPDNPYRNAITDETTAGEAKAIVGDPAAAATGAETSEWSQTHLRMVEKDLDSAVVAAAASGDAGGFAPTHLRMVEQDLDTGGAVESETASVPGPTHLQMIEGDLDTGNAFEARIDAGSGVPTHLQMIEQDLDTGVTPSDGDVAPGPSDGQISEF